MQSDVLIPFAFILASGVLNFWFGRWYERRRWRGSVRVLKTTSTTLTVADASQFAEGDMITMGTAALNPDWGEPVASLAIPSPWIPVEEHLPEDFDAVVILARECDGYVYRGLASYDAQYSKWIVNGGSGHGLTVSHWLELPPLPVAEVKE